MRKVREVLHLASGKGLSRRQVSEALRLPASTVGDYLKRAAGAGVTWPLPDGLD
ncbi:transposase subunit, partial [mine drainage metagenome]